MTTVHPAAGTPATVLFASFSEDKKALLASDGVSKQGSQRCCHSLGVQPICWRNMKQNAEGVL